LPCAASPFAAIVVALLDVVVDPLVTEASGAVEALVVVVVVELDDWSPPFAHPAATNTAIAPAASNANGFESMMMLLISTLGRYPDSGWFTLRREFARRSP
jgi:hypothetical protein